jgi:hypothetical protein
VDPDLWTGLRRFYGGIQWSLNFTNESADHSQNQLIVGWIPPVIVKNSGSLDDGL